MAMAANCARRTLQVASAATKTQLCRRSLSALASNANDFTGFASCGPTIASRISAHKLSLSFNRLPKQLAVAQMSLMPLYSVTASALFTSLLSVHNNKWGCLSEGFATPL